jgi:PAS domain S-box-containing protein
MQNSKPYPPQKRFPKELLLIFLSISCFIIVGGGYFYHIQKNRITQSEYHELAAIADLKVSQITDWRWERRVDGEVIFNSPILVDYVEHYLLARDANGFSSKILQQMKAIMRYGDYANIYLLDVDAKVRLTVNEKKMEPGTEAFLQAQEAMHNKKVILSDLHLNKPSGPIHIDIIVPLMSIRTGTPRAIGAVVLQIDPDRYLYPRIKSWPTPSPSGETLLVRREGKDIVYLNELRHKKNTALTLKMSTDEQNLPAALVVRGYTGIVEGIDYRGVPVLAAVRHIPDSNWFLVSKIDKSEVFAPTLRQAIYIAVIALLMIIAIGAVTGILWQRDRVSQFSLLYASEKKRQEERAHADALISAVEERYRYLFNNMQEGFAYCRMIYSEDIPLDFIYLSVNSAFETLTGLKNVVGKKVSEVIPGIREADPGLFDVYGRVAKTGKPERFDTYVHALQMWFSISVYCPEPGCFVAVFDVITERKLTEKALHKLLDDLKRSNTELQESETRYKSLFDESLDCIFKVDNNGIIVMTNRAGAEMFGFQSPEEVIGSPAVRLWADHDERKKFFTVLQRDKMLRGYPVKAKKRTGGIIHLEVSCHLLEDEQGNSLGMEGILRDITERKVLEEQLLQSQKIEAVGTLAGGVAHDFNNILTAIIGYTHVVLMKMKQDDPLRYELQQVLAAADRAAMLTQSLLAFSRKQMVHLAPIEVNDVLKKFGIFLHRLIREDIEISTTTSDEKLTVLADKGQIEQALMNLVTNAQDAMPNGGRLLIETRPCSIDDSFIAAHGYGKPGEYVLISVSDTGIGMDDQTKQKIFEPFFTTKEVGKGTGLGLALVYGTVKKHEGFITVDSEPGEGTTFKIYLPLTDQPQEKLSRPSAFETAYAAGGTETILLAEDDEAIRTMETSILTNAGYNIIAAVDGMDAIRKYTEHKDSIRLALLDVIMPKKNGQDVYKEIAPFAPGLKVIFMSGYTEGVFDSGELRGKDVSFLLKPVSPEELLRKIRSVLNEGKQIR